MKFEEIPQEKKNDLTPEKEIKHTSPPFVYLGETKLNPDIKALKNNPDKLVRVRRIIEPQDLTSEKSGGLQFSIEEFKKGRDLFEKLKNKYGIAVPNAQLIVGEEMYRGKYVKKMFTVIDRIYGKSLDNTDVLESETVEKLDNLLLGLIQHNLDVYKSGGDYFVDFSLGQIVWGHRKGEEGKQFYLIDTDPIFKTYDPFDPSTEENSPLYNLCDIVRNIEAIENKFRMPAKLVKTRTAVLDILKNIPAKVPARSFLFKTINRYLLHRY